jgi:hypothetical protein
VFQTSTAQNPFHRFQTSTPDIIHLNWKLVSYNYRKKGKGHPTTGHQGPRGRVDIQLYSFSTSALGERWSALRSDRFTLGKDPVPTVQEAGWAPGPVWTCAKKLAPTGIRSPDRPARSQSLYRLSYPAHLIKLYVLCNILLQISLVSTSFIYKYRVKHRYSPFQRSTNWADVWN